MLLFLSRHSHSELSLEHLGIINTRKQLGDLTLARTTLPLGRIAYLTSRRSCLCIQLDNSEATDTSS